MSVAVSRRLVACAKGGQQPWVGFTSRSVGECARIRPCLGRVGSSGRREAAVDGEGGFYGAYSAVRNESVKDDCEVGEDEAGGTRRSKEWMSEARQWAGSGRGRVVGERGMEGSRGGGGGGVER